MTHFHCLHGAWHGGWVWNGVAEKIRQNGHSVSAPDLPGLGSLSSDLNSDINLERHIAAAKPDQPSILIAHSYAGVLARAVLDRFPELVKDVLLIEALWPEDNQAVIDLLSESARDAMTVQIRDHGQGWKIPAPDASRFDLNNSELEALINSKLTAHPASTFIEPLSITGTDVIGSEFVGTYVISTDRDPQPYTLTAEKLKALGWRIIECHGGHALMLTQVDLVTNLSLKLVKERTDYAT